MLFTYDSIKEEVRERREGFRDYYYNFFDIFEEFYNPELVKCVYIKNIFNSNKNETIFFFDNKVVSVTKKDIHFTIEENRSKIIDKVIYVSEHSSRQINLELTFDNGEKIVFDNYKDSNESCAGEYGLDIKELYKLI